MTRRQWKSNHRNELLEKTFACVIFRLSYLKLQGINIKYMVTYHQRNEEEEGNTADCKYTYFERYD
jgi:hypothetical protein